MRPLPLTCMLMGRASHVFGLNQRSSFYLLSKLGNMANFGITKPPESREGVLRPDSCAVACIVSTEVLYSIVQLLITVHNISVCDFRVSLFRLHNQLDTTILPELFSLNKADVLSSPDPSQTAVIHPHCYRSLHSLVLV